MKSNTLINEMIIDMTIVPKSPLLVKSSEDNGNSIDWLTRDGKPFIPGSTLKGLFREKYTSIYYDYLKKDSDKLEDDSPLDKHQDDMEEKVDKTLKREDVYNESLEVEKLFGSKVLKSRFWAGDAFCKTNKSIEEIFKIRNITPIDRFTGGAVVPLVFQYTEEKFEFQLRIRNINNEELKTLLFIIRDSQNGEIRVGNSKTRGFGEIEFEIKDLAFKEYKKTLNLDNFSEINMNNSIKIGKKFLVKELNLQEEFKEIKSSNEFVQSVMKGDN